jgi:hypothetical protein
VVYIQHPTWGDVSLVNCRCRRHRRDTTGRIAMPAPSPQHERWHAAPHRQRRPLHGHRTHAMVIWSRSGIACTSTRTMANRRSNHRQRWGLRATRARPQPQCRDAPGRTVTRARRQAAGAQQIQQACRCTTPPLLVAPPGVTLIVKMSIEHTTTLTFLQCAHLATHECPARDRTPPLSRFLLTADQKAFVNDVHSTTSQTAGSDAHHMQGPGGHRKVA